MHDVLDILRLDEIVMNNSKRAPNILFLFFNNLGFGELGSYSGGALHGVRAFLSRSSINEVIQGDLTLEFQGQIGADTNHLLHVHRLGRLSGMVTISVQTE